MLLSEQALISQCRNGDKGAFQKLVESYEDRVYALIYNIIYDYEMARDISQEAWLRVYLNIKRFDLTKPFYPWLARIATNLCIDYLRKSKPIPKEPVDYKETKTAKPVEAAENEETREYVRRLLQQLPRNYRTALILSEVEGLKSGEIARIVKANPITVRWRVYQAKKMFKELWKYQGNNGYERY